MKSRILFTALLISGSMYAQNQPIVKSQSAALLKVGKLTFKDLNKNQKLDKYEDWRLPVAERVKDLVSQMTIEEKLGFMLISTTRMGGDNVFANGVQGGGPKPVIID